MRGGNSLTCTVGGLGDRRGIDPGAVPGVTGRLGLLDAFLHHGRRLARAWRAGRPVTRVRDVLRRTERQAVAAPNWRMGSVDIA